MKKRILTGDRPTGKLHLGHYVGSIANRVKLQYDYEEYLLIADVQALTTNFDHPERLALDVREVAMDNLACGIDPKTTTICVQSKIPEIFELTSYFSMFTTVSSLRRNPTIKTEIKQLGLQENIMYGFLGYPVSQAADITIFEAHLVPVGEDQMPILEATREIVRKFNRLYKDVLTEPDGLVGEVGRLVGTDGQAKMSKSLGNVIYLCDDEKAVEKKVGQMFTDPEKIRLGDKGHPHKCPVCIYHATFNLDKEEVDGLKKECLSGKRGCVECKKRLSEVLNSFLTPIREKRKIFEKNPDLVDDILITGIKKARTVTTKTIEKVREAMKIDYFKGTHV
ncbi:MAG: tryptophan--tRNA ligase [Candidatus Omnitrophota bacterium]